MGSSTTKVIEYVYLPVDSSCQQTYSILRNITNIEGYVLITDVQVGRSITTVVIVPFQPKSHSSDVIYRLLHLGTFHFMVLLN